MLEQLTTTQKTALAVGVPVVGLAVLWNRRNGAPAEAAPNDTPAEDAAAPAGVIPGYVASTDAIGTGTLASYFTTLTESIAGLNERTSDLENKPATTPGPRPVPNTVHQTYVLAGETPNAIAIRLRNAGARTAAGQPITAVYLIRFNHWDTSATAKRWPGELVSY